MKFNRPLMAALYAVAALMIIVPLLEVVLSVWPLRLNQTSWRFGTFGLLSQTIMTPLLGLLLLVIATVLIGYWRALQAIAVLAALAALFLLIGLPLFALDAVQMRAQVRPQAMRAYDLSATMAALKLTATFFIAVFIALGSWKAARENRRRSPQTGAPLLAHTRA
jgi:hypothetical protein